MSTTGIRGALRLVNVTPVCSTGAMGANQVLFTQTLVENAAVGVNQPFKLESICVLDEDDQTAANLTFFFYDAAVSLGTINEDPSITDANNRNCLGVVPFASSLLIDVVGSKVGSLHNIGLVCKPVADTKSIYVAALTAGTPTQTASGIKLRLGFADF